MLFFHGDLIDERYKILHPLGSGSFGQIFVAADTLAPGDGQTLVAIKAEPMTHLNTQITPIAIEAAVLRVLPSGTGPAFLSAGALSFGGRRDGHVGAQFVVMELLGRSLADLRHSCGGRFSLSTALLVADSMLSALQRVHEIGIVHRDVKPSNFCILRDTVAFDLRIIDFGLARRFADAGGKVRAPRPAPGFRGTARYASCAAHEGRELGPVDDLWSLLYILVESLTGNLPWRRLRNRDAIGRCKRKHGLPRELCAELPLPVQRFGDIISSLDRSESIPYDFLHLILRSGVHSPHAPDWLLVSPPPRLCPLAPTAGPDDEIASDHDATLSLTALDLRAEAVARAVGRADGTGHGFAQLVLSHTLARDTRLANHAPAAAPDRLASLVTAIATACPGARAAAVVPATREIVVGGLGGECGEGWGARLAVPLPAVVPKDEDDGWFD